MLFWDARAGNIPLWKNSAELLGWERQLLEELSMDKKTKILGEKKVQKSSKHQVMHSGDGRLLS